MTFISESITVTQVKGKNRDEVETKKFYGKQYPFGCTVNPV